MRKKPYFLTNEEWYYYDEKEYKYKLTDKATPEAIESYNEYYLPYNKDYGNEEDFKKLLQKEKESIAKSKKQLYDIKSELVNETNKLD